MLRVLSGDVVRAYAVGRHGRGAACWKQRVAVSVNGPGAARIVSVSPARNVTEDSLSRRRRIDQVVHAYAPICAQELKVAKDECLVLDYRPAEASAEAVLHELPPGQLAL